MGKLRLPHITLIALTGRESELPQHEEAIDKSSTEIEWGASKVVYDPRISNIDDWSYEVFYNLGKHVNTSHAILIHSNGYVVHPECWRDEWLQYDFAGSPFPLPTDDFSYRDVNGVIQRVGNSVGLRSKKLMDLPRKLGIEWRSFHGYFNEDGAISVNYRHIFEENGCKFMPFEEALHFGRENELPENQDIDKTFVFHNYKGRNEKYA